MRDPPGPVQSSALSHDPALARRLWQVSERLTSVPYAMPNEHAAVAPPLALSGTSP